MEANKAAKKKDGNFVSTNYSSIGWSSVSSVFNAHQYTQEIAPLRDTEFNILTNYLALVARCFPDLSGKEAKRLYFISPIIVAVCSSIDGVTIAVEEDLVGENVKANGHFEMMLMRGSKRVCIVEAKKDDMDQGKAQCLVGCEVAAELDSLSVVYGIVTNYIEWEFTKSTDTDVFIDQESLLVQNLIPNSESLQQIAGKICKMLSDDY